MSMNPNGTCHTELAPVRHVSCGKYDRDHFEDCEGNGENGARHDPNSPTVFFLAAVLGEPT